MEVFVVTLFYSILCGSNGHFSYHLSSGIYFQDLTSLDYMYECKLFLVLTLPKPHGLLPSTKFHMKYFVKRNHTQYSLSKMPIYASNHFTI